MRSLGQNPTEAELMDMIQEVSYAGGPTGEIAPFQSVINGTVVLLLLLTFYRSMPIRVEPLISLNS